MNTKVAIAFYYLSIGSVVFCGDVIAVKLIFWPPCTQMGHNCVVDGWSVAGLAATVLAVAATVLAVLGAVAVAAWWTSLNARVTEQVTKLAEALKTEVDTRVDRILQDQQRKVEKQLEEFRAQFVKVEAGIARVNEEAAQAASNSRAAKQKVDDMKFTIEIILENATSAREQIDDLTEFTARLVEAVDDTSKFQKLLEEVAAGDTPISAAPD